MVTLTAYITALSMALSGFGDFQFNAQTLGGTTTAVTYTGAARSTAQRMGSFR